MTEPASSDLPPMPAAPPKIPASRKMFLIGLATGLAASGLMAGGLFLALKDSDSAAVGDSKPTATATATAAKVAQAPTEEPEEVYNEAPSSEEFTITLKTTSKQCFGSAGCNVTVEPKLSYVGLLPPDPDKTYSITYEVRGGEDGPVIQTMELTEQDSLSYRPVAMSTARSGADLTVKVTDVQVSG